MNKKPSNFDDYLIDFPEDVREKLIRIREVILEVAPKADEVISYGLPAFKLKGMLVYFAGYKNHIGFYPMPSAIEAFDDKLGSYKKAKGSVQFPLNEPIPLDLIKEMVKFRVYENNEKAKLKRLK